MPVISAYTIDGNKVYIDDSNAYISAEPNTLVDSGWVYINIRSKIYTGNIDVTLGFDTTVNKPLKAELYSPELIYYNETQEAVIENVQSINFTDNKCDIGHEYNNYRKEVTRLLKSGTKSGSNDTKWVTDSLVICFDSYINDSGTYTIYYNTINSEMIAWHDITNKFGSIYYPAFGMTQWYYYTDIPIIADTEYLIRVYIKVDKSKLTSTGKYWIAIKPSSETIAESIMSSHLYYLDPWWNSTWDYRQNITIDNFYTDNLTNYPIEVTLDTTDSSKFGDGSGFRVIYNLSDSVNWINTTEWNIAQTKIRFRIDCAAKTNCTEYAFYYGAAGLPDTRTNQTDVMGIIKDANTKLLFRLDEVSGNRSFSTGTSAMIMQHQEELLPQDENWFASNRSHCMIDGCVELDGYNQSLKGSALSVAPDNDFSLVGWIYYDGNMQYDLATIFDRWDLGGTLKGDIFNGIKPAPNENKSEITIFSTVTLETNRTVNGNSWEHYAVTRTGNVYTYYLNGEPAGTTTDADDVDDSSNTHNWYIGCAGGNREFSGRLDEQAYFTRQLSLIEIRHQSLYYTPKYVLSAEDTNISNDNPNATVPSITPATAYTNSDLNCSTIPTDTENSSLILDFAWSLNNDGCDGCSYNTTISGDINGSLIYTTKLVTQQLQPNDNWTCMVRVYDGQSYSSWINTTIQISNTPLIWTEQPPNITINYDIGYLKIKLNTTDPDPNQTKTFLVNDSDLVFGLNGYYNWTFNLSDAGTHYFNVNVSDTIALIEADFWINITNITAPVIIQPSYLQVDAASISSVMILFILIFFYIALLILANIYRNSAVLMLAFIVGNGIGIYIMPIGNFLGIAVLLFNTIITITMFKS